MPLETALAQVQQKIDFSLKSHLERLACPSLRLKEAILYGALAPGKRLRAFLHMIFAEAFKVPDSSALQVATAIELVHAYSLIHDDLPAMDNSELRRGIPSLHCQYDEATALLAGSSLLIYAFQMLAEPLVHPKAHVRCEVISHLTQAVGAPGMVSGQMLDLEGETKLLSLDEISNMQDLKTGALFSFCCVSAGILGEKDPEILKALHLFSFHFGLAFQITDDLLDATAVSEKLGKPVQRDHKKSTFVSLLGLEGAQEQAHFHVHKGLEILEEINVPLAQEVTQFILKRTH